MSNFKILLKNNFLEIFRTKKWLIYLLVFVVISITSTLTAKYLVPMLMSALESLGISYTATIVDAYTEFITNMSEVAYLLITIMFSTTLLKEKTSLTYYTLKSNGVKEREIVLAHYVSKLVLITVCYLISVLVFEGGNLLLFSKYTGLNGVISLTYVYLMLVFALTFAIFVSSFIKKKALGVVFAILSYLVLSIVMIIESVRLYTPLYALTIANETIQGYDVSLTDYLINAGSTIGLCILFVVLSIYFFKNKIDNRK